MDEFIVKELHCFDEGMGPKIVTLSISRNPQILPQDQKHTIWECLAKEIDKYALGYKLLSHSIIPCNVPNSSSFTDNIIVHMVFSYK